MTVSSVAFLLAQLKAIDQSSSSIVSHVALETFFEGLEGLNQNDRRRLVEGGTFETIIAASMRTGQNPHFYHRSLGILCMFLMQEQDNEEYALQVLEKGGIDSAIGIMQTMGSNEFLQVTGITLLVLLLSNLPVEKCSDLSATILENVVKAMELHKESAKLFEFGCNAIGNSFAPGAKISQDLAQRAVSCVWYGVTKHSHDEEAQEVGRCLLYHMVGPETAKAMIDHAEYHHCADADCSCAA